MRRRRGEDQGAYEARLAKASAARLVALAARDAALNELLGVASEIGDSWLPPIHIVREWRDRIKAAVEVLR